MWRERREQSSMPPDLGALLEQPLEGFKKSKVYSVTAIPQAKEPLPDGASPAAEHARKFIGRGAHEPFMPFIMCRTRGPLEIILKMSCQGYGPWDTSSALIRPAFALVTLDDLWAAPEGGLDSREIAPDNGPLRLDLFPKWQWLLHDEEFHEIIEEDAHAFLTALGFEPPQIEIPTSNL